MTITIVFGQGDGTPTIQLPIGQARNTCAVSVLGISGVRMPIVQARNTCALVAFTDLAISMACQQRRNTCDIEAVGTRSVAVNPTQRRNTCDIEISLLNPSPPQIKTPASEQYLARAQGKYRVRVPEIDPKVTEEA